MLERRALETGQLIWRDSTGNREKMRGLREEKIGRRDEANKGARKPTRNRVPAHIRESTKGNMGRTANAAVLRRYSPVLPAARSVPGSIPAFAWVIPIARLVSSMCLTESRGGTEKACGRCGYQSTIKQRLLTPGLPWRVRGVLAP